MTGNPMRGRPRQYDPDRALAAALGEFRQRGYAATSLDHLSAATGMKRPSLYAAFGNKRDVYLKAVERFRQDRVREQTRLLFDERPLAGCLEAYFDAVLASYAPVGDAPLGCPVICVIAGEAVEEPVLGAELASTLRGMDAMFLKRLETARRSGELAEDTDLKALALLLGGLQQSIALRARAGASRNDLMDFVRAAIAHLLGKGASFGPALR